MNINLLYRVIIFSKLNSQNGIRSEQSTLTVSIKSFRTSQDTKGRSLPKLVGSYLLREDLFLKTVSK